MAGHRVLYDIDKSNPLTDDPGTGAKIVVTRWNQVIGLTIAESASETNTLASPTKAGRRLHLFAKSVGSNGSRVVTVASAINQAGATTLTFANVDDYAVLESYPVGDNDFEWRITSSEGVGGFLPTTGGTMSGDIVLGDTVDLALGADSDALLRWSTGDADNHGLVLALGDTSQMLHITDKGAVATDWAVTSPTHPTVYVHSNTTPATDYLRLGNHTGTIADIDVVGGTTLSLQIASTEVAKLLAGGLTLNNGSDLVFEGATGENEMHLTDNLADAFSIKIAGGADFMVFDSTNTNEKLSILSAATQKLGFFGVAPVVQGTAYTQTLATADKTHAARTAVDLTDSSGGTPADTITALADGSTYANDVASLRNNLASLARACDRLLVDQLDTAAFVNSLVDDLQLFGLIA